MADRLAAARAGVAQRAFVSRSSGKGSGQKAKGKDGDSSVATQLWAVTSEPSTSWSVGPRTFSLPVPNQKRIHGDARLAPRQGASSQRGSRCSGGSGRSKQNPATTFLRQRSWLSAGAPLCHSDGAIRYGHCRRHTGRSSSSVAPKPGGQRSRSCHLPQARQATQADGRTPVGLAHEVGGTPTSCGRGVCYVSGCPMWLLQRGSPNRAAHQPQQLPGWSDGQMAREAGGRGEERAGEGNDNGDTEMSDSRGKRGRR